MWLFEKLLTHIITPTPLEKKKILDLFTLSTIVPMFRGKEDRRRGIIKKSRSMELAGTFQNNLTHCSDNNISSAQA